MKLLLHACCGPCALEPVRLLQEAGHDLTIAYMNPNIHPAQEYARRRDTLLAWAGAEGIPVVEGVYDAALWEEAVAPVIADPAYERKERCRACYRLRFEEAACYGAEHGFEGIGTTLSVSPYQFTDVIAEELGRAGAEHGLTALFEDYRPYYPEATRRSRALGMYRQNYCGCRLSEAEAAAEREERKRARAAQKAQKAQEAQEAQEAETQKPGPQPPYAAEAGNAAAGGGPRIQQPPCAAEAGR